MDVPEENVVSITSESNPVESVVQIISKRSMKRIKKEEKLLLMKQKWKKNHKKRDKNRSRKRNRAEKKRSVEFTKISKRHVVIDYSYTDLMTSKNVLRAVNQGMRCYSSNRISANPFKLHFCSFEGTTKQMAMRHDGIFNWDVCFHEQNFLDVFDKKDIVYLTSESENVLTTLEDDKVYVIGGLVDHNSKKGISLERAIEAGINHARLPVKNHISVITKYVFTINHVFDILLRVNNDETWQDAFIKAVPSRLHAVPAVKSDPDATVNYKGLIENKVEEIGTDNKHENETIPEK